jgi:hypothetical protein
MKRTLLATLALLTLTVSAEAQRCPAGQDQFHNCLSMNPGMRARQEQWANQPAARRIPGAQPYGTPPLVTGTTPTLRGVRYRLANGITFVHHRDGRTTTFITADGRRGSCRGRCTFSDGSPLR